MYIILDIIKFKYLFTITFSYAKHVELNMPKAKIDGVNLRY